MRALISFLLILSLSACSHSKVTSLTQVRVDGDDLILSGTFDQYTNTLVKNALASHSNITTLVFTDNGGSINDEATLALGRYIRQKRLNTHIADGGVIASGGLSLFLAGVKRSKGENIKIGVHSWQHCQGDGDEQVCKDAQNYSKDDNQHNLHRDYIVDMLGDDGFYWFSINASPSAEIYWLTADDTIKFRIFNKNKSQITI